MREKELCTSQLDRHSSKANKQILGPLTVGRIEIMTKTLYGFCMRALHFREDLLKTEGYCAIFFT